MKTFFLSLFFFLGGSLIFAQNVLLKGSVGDGKSPLPEATLSVEGQEVHITSDGAGNFQFSLPKGFYILDIHAKGYRSQRMNIELTDNLTLAYHNPFKKNLWLRVNILSEIQSISLMRSSMTKKVALR